MFKHLFKLLIVILIVLTTTSYTFAATATWDFSNAGEYTLSDTDELEVSGGSGLLQASDEFEEIGDLTHSENNSFTAFTPQTGAVSSDGNYLYIPTTSNNSLQVVNISDRENPTYVTTIADDGSLYLANPDGAVVDGDYLYIIGKNDDGFQIFDISNPAAPVAAGSILDDVTTRLDLPVDVAIQGNYAYITSYDNDGVEVLDISDKNNPVHAGEIGNGVGGALLYNPREIKVVGNYAYVGSGNNAIEVIDVSNPATPVHAGSITDGTDGLDFDLVYDVEISGNYLYASSYFTDSIIIIDISTPSSPSYVTTIFDDGLTALDGVRNLEISGDYLYAVSFIDNGVSAFDISDPESPVFVSSIFDDGSTILSSSQGMVLSGDNLFVSSNNDFGISVLNIPGYHYPTTTPYITPTTANSFPYGLTSFSETLDSGNEGTVTYQVSTDNGTTWYYWNGSAWTSTTQTNGTETSSVSDINTNIDTLDTDGGNFLWRAFLDSDGTQITGIDALSLVYETATVTPVSAPVLQTASDLGILDNDGITNTTTPTFDLTCLANSEITLYSNGSDIGDSGTGTCSGGGTLSLTPTLGEGTQDITFVQLDSVGGATISDESPALSITVDTTAITPNINKKGDQLDPTPTKSATFTITSSETIDTTDIDVNTFTTAASTASGTSISSVTFPTSTTIQVTVTSTTDGDITLGFASIGDIKDIAGNVSVASTTTDATVTVSASTDTDGDGNPDLTEDAGPNGGDANGDGFLDSTQQSVSTVTNSITGSYTTLAAAGDCSVITENTVVDESGLIAQDPTADYPVGLVDFEVECDDPGDSTTITIYYTEEYDTSLWVYKKYDSSGSAYSDITDNVTFGTAVVGATTVTTVTLNLTDGDPDTDEDGIANGVIVDPSGPAVATSSGKRPTTRRSPEEVARIFGYTTPTTTPSVSNKELCPSNQLLTQNMKSGDRNGNYSSWQGGTITEVKILQTHMNRLGFNAGPVDGILGPLTDAAIKAMQTSLGTTPDGYVGPNTRARINTSCTPTNTSTTSLSQEALRALILQLQQQLEVLQKELA